MGTEQPKTADLPRNETAFCHLKTPLMYDRERDDYCRLYAAEDNYGCAYSITADVALRTALTGTE